jgi:hypothetical protein
MKHKTYTLSSRLSPEEAIVRVGDLLAAERVKYTVEGLSISSTRTPIAVLSFQRVLYSKRNWVGLNPFIYISGLNVECQPDGSGVTRVIVRLNRLRTFVWVAFWVWNSAVVALKLPRLPGVIVFVGFCLAAWFGYVSFLSGYLIRKEISDCLKGVESAAAVFPRDSGLTTQD